MSTDSSPLLDAQHQEPEPEHIVVDHQEPEPEHIVVDLELQQQQTQTPTQQQQQTQQPQRTLLKTQWYYQALMATIALTAFINQIAMTYIGNEDFKTKVIYHTILLCFSITFYFIYLRHLSKQGLLAD